MRTVHLMNINLGLRSELLHFSTSPLHLLFLFYGINQVLVYFCYRRQIAEVGIVNLLPGFNSRFDISNRLDFDL